MCIRDSLGVGQRASPRRRERSHAGLRRVRLVVGCRGRGHRRRPAAVQQRARDGRVAPVRGPRPGPDRRHTGVPARGGGFRRRHRVAGASHRVAGPVGPPLPQRRGDRCPPGPPSVGRQVVPVSYTHLDVYKRQTNIAGDVSLEYQVTRDGRYVLKAYRKNEYQVAIQGEIVETGVAFVITMEYNKFKELFQRSEEEKAIIAKQKLDKEKKAKAKEVKENLPKE